MADSEESWELWTVEETYTRARVSRSTLYRSDCPYIPKGKRGRVYDPQQVAAFFRGRLTHSVLDT